MSKFVLRAVSSGIKFDLRADNGQVILTSEVYRSRAAALRGIASIGRCAQAACLEDRTAAVWAAAANPKFEVYRDRAGQYRFRLRARNGRIVGTSEGYAARAGCLNGIDSVRRSAPAAAVEG